MRAQDVVELYKTLFKNGVKIWIDGGWGVDALLGEETRPHSDLDIAIQEKDLPRLLAFLTSRKYVDVPRDDTSTWNFVMGDKLGRLIDIHVINIDDKGDGIYGPKENGLMYPAESLTGRGKINKVPVRCISAEYVVKFHTQYEPQEKDYQDVSKVCARFSIELPEMYQKFKN